jgi:hypothetical protein
MRTVSGMNSVSRAIAADRRPAFPACAGLIQVLDVDDADHVVEAAVAQGIAGVARVARALDVVRERFCARSRKITRRAGP